MIRNTKNKRWKYYKQLAEILKTNSGNTTNKRQKYYKQTVEILQTKDRNTTNKQWNYYQQIVEILQTNSGNTTNKRQKYYKQIVEILQTKDRILQTNSGKDRNTRNKQCRTVPFPRSRRAKPASAAQMSNVAAPVQFNLNTRVICPPCISSTCISVFPCQTKTPVSSAHLVFLKPVSLYFPVGPKRLCHQPTLYFFNLYFCISKTCASSVFVLWTKTHFP